MRSFTPTSVLAAVLLWSAAASAADPAPIPDSDKSDYLVVYGGHAPAKPTDPVVVRFEAIKVTKVQFARPVAKGLEGAAAEFQIDVSSLKTGVDNRDRHLKSPDYLDAAKFSTITVQVSKPRRIAGDQYEAPARLTVRGKTYDWKVRFTVVEKLADGVRIRGEHKFSRKDIAVGKESGDGVGQDLLVRLQLTLRPAKPAQ
jgi:polyisoprenoid-binding protein YceI